MVLLAGAIILWVPGLVWYISTMPQKVDDPTTAVEAIVVLTGGSDRLHEGLSLLRHNIAPVLFVSGVHPGIDLDTLLVGVPPGVRRRVTLGHVATDTEGNAMETAAWMKTHRLTSLRLVTASYHMPRSLLEFRAALPHATIIAHPVFPATVKQDSWWSYPGTTALFAREYSKYLIARLRLMIAPHTSPPI